MRVVLRRQQSRTHTSPSEVHTDCRSRLKRVPSRRDAAASAARFTATLQVYLYLSRVKGEEDNTIVEKLKESFTFCLNAFPPHVEILRRHCTAAPGSDEGEPSGEKSSPERVVDLVRGDEINENWNIASHTGIELRGAVGLYY
ncbi:hypothetical protein EYF80_060574 [Liparis tanakae]|uniref:Uncharacterized protein n=1 Tax=Liparis tanakae TaxID=230148 RepID=A0A4Z2EKE2_9TELE|nr:hypothetical protein EYF80_060574 [Liparis tanakae]